MANAPKAPSKHHDRVKAQYQSTIKFQCAQPSVLCSPMMFRAPFNAFQFAQYRPNSVDSTNPQVAFLSDDLGLPALVDPIAYMTPLDLPKGPDGNPLMDPADVELLPDHQVEHHLRKLLGKQTNMPVWLRNTEYTELPVRQDGIEGAKRQRARTLMGKSKADEEDLEVAPEEEGTLAEGVEHSFNLAMALDKEFSDCKAFMEKGEPFKRQWLVHPNPSKRQAVPVGVWHVFPHYAMWRTSYVSVNFMDGNPIPPERLVPPGTDFSSLPPSRQTELYLGAQDHDDSLLLHFKGTDEEADVLCPEASQGTDLAYTFLIPRMHRSRLPDSAPDGEDEDEDEGPPKKRSREYERVADFMAADDIMLGRKENAPRMKDRDLCLVFADAEGVANYVKLEDQVHLKRKVRKRGDSDPKKGKLYVVETRPLTNEEEVERSRRYECLTGEESQHPPSQNSGRRSGQNIPGPRPEELEEESAEAIIHGILARHELQTQQIDEAQPHQEVDGDSEGGDPNNSEDDRHTEVPEDADLDNL